MDSAGRSQNTTFERWRWTDALATARPGARYRIARIPSSLARDRCRELGCAEGEVMVCTHNRGGLVGLERSDGGTVLLERGLAWFIQARAEAAAS